jgi:hypothetical protein
MPIITARAFDPNQSWLDVGRLTFLPVPGEPTDEIMSYTTSTNRTMADPGSGIFRWNNADQSLITEVAISTTDRNGIDKSVILTALTVGRQLSFAQNDTRWFTGVVSAVITNNTTWVLIPFLITATGAIMQNNQPAEVLIALDDRALPRGSDLMDIRMAQEWPWILFRLFDSGNSVPKNLGVIPISDVQSITFR